MRQYGPMKRILTFAVMLGYLVAVASGCGSSSSKGSSSTTTAPKASSNGSGSGSGKSPVAFCSMLAADTDKTAAFAASIGTPTQAAKLAEINADNGAILAAAPSDVHDAVAKFYEVSALARAALDPSLSAGAKAAAAANAATAVGTPEAKAAIADYKTWVQTNCGSLSSKILSGGL